MLKINDNFRSKRAKHFRKEMENCQANKLSL